MDLLCDIQLMKHFSVLLCRAVDALMCCDLKVVLKAPQRHTMSNDFVH